MMKANILDSIDDNKSIYKIKTINEHFQTKSMWMGSMKLNICNDFIYDLTTDQINIKTIKYSECLYKCIDELLVNVIDHWFKNKSKCTKLFVNFDSKTNKIKIANNGPGIPLTKMTLENGQIKWLPEILITIPYSGSNFELNNYSGGTNGLGMKLVNNHSIQFNIKTITNNTEYQQQFSTNNVNEPKIIQTNSKDKTVIEILLDYVNLGYKTMNNENYQYLYDIIITRLINLSAYINHFNNKQKFTVSFNDINIHVLDIEHYVSLFFNTDQKPKQYRFNLEKPLIQYSIIINDSLQGNSLSILNGVIIHNGYHIDWIIDKIVDKLRPKLTKIYNKYNIKFNKSHIKNKLFIFTFGIFNNPEWTGQRKDNITIIHSEFNNVMTDLNVIAFNKMTDKLYNDLKDLLIDQLDEKNINKQKQKKKLKILKYTQAERLNGKIPCHLFITEGDSAEMMIRIGLGCKNSKLSRKYYGSYILGGVIMNVRKKVKYKQIKGKDCIIQSKKLQNNKFFNEIIQILNLNLNETYDTTKSLSKLSYKSIIIATDQDLDGIGHIFSLVINVFDLFWPNLLYKHHYIKRLATPIIRLLPRNKSNKMIEIFDENDLKLYDDQLEQYEIKYYKGLASHSRSMVIDMFSRFDTLLYDYFGIKDCVNNNTNKVFDKYFGINTLNRKIELSKPIRELSNIEIKNKENMLTNCVTHLDIETKKYQLDSLDRRIPHIIDGMNNVRRKILCGSRKYFNKNSKTIKVFQLCGIIANSMAYHHGDKSLGESIISMVQSYPGAINFPLFVEDGLFGTRFKGSQETIGTRYISTKYDYDIGDKIFKIEDNIHLTYNYIDGQKCQPNHYIPIVPMVLLEMTYIPATGWNCCIMSRNIGDVIQNIKNKLNNKPLISMKPYIHGFKGLIDDYNSIGLYEIINDKHVRITEIPFNITIEKYIKKLNSLKYITKCEDNCSDNDIDILITINKDFQFNDDYLDRLYLIKSYQQNINLKNIDGSIISFDNYIDPFNIWFDYRKKIYEKRYKRDIMILKIRIKYLKNKIKFIDQNKELNYLKESNTIQELTDLLINSKYAKLDNTKYNLINNIETSELISIFNGSNINYNYLLNMSFTYLVNSNQFMKKLKIYQDELKRYKLYDLDNYIANIWINELDELSNELIKRHY